MLLYPFLKIVAKAINEKTSCGAIFKAGEVLLQAMKKQINDPDEASLYYAGGIIKFYKINQLEVLLLETSSSFGSSDKTKASFDHHKGLFSVLVMLKVVADEFQVLGLSQYIFQTETIFCTCFRKILQSVNYL